MRTRNARRVLAVTTLTFLIMSLLVAMAMPVLAHHPIVTANADCETESGTFVVTGTATAWVGGALQRTNPSIEVHRDSYDGPLVATGEFSASNGYSFAWQDVLPGDHPSPVTYVVVAKAPWGNGTPPRGPGDLHPDQFAQVALEGVCVPPLVEASVTVVPGTCRFDGEESLTPVAVTIDPASGATVTIVNASEQVVASFTESGSAELPPGSYAWSASAAEGYVLTGPTAGEFTALACEPPPNMTDLAVTKVGPAGPVAEGDRVTYTITVINNGPLDEPEAVVVDTLPETFVFVSAVPSQGTCSEASGTVTCNLGALDVGDTATVAVTAQTSRFGRYTNVVTVAGRVPDSNPTNNRDTEVTDVITVLPTTVTSVPTTSTTVAATSDTLPYTGPTQGGLAGIGVGLLALGGLAVLAVGRREDDQPIHS